MAKRFHFVHEENPAVCFVHRQKYCFMGLQYSLPLNPNSDQDQFSPKYIYTLSRDQF